MTAHSSLNQKSQEPLWALFCLRFGGLIFPLSLQTTCIIRLFPYFLPLNQDAVSVACSQGVLIQSSVLPDADGRDEQFSRVAGAL